MNFLSFNDFITENYLFELYAQTYYDAFRKAVDASKCKDLDNLLRAKRAAQAANFRVRQNPIIKKEAEKLAEFLTTEDHSSVAFSVEVLQFIDDPDNIPCVTIDFYREVPKDVEYRILIKGPELHYCSTENMITGEHCSTNILNRFERFITDKILPLDDLKVATSANYTAARAEKFEKEQKEKAELKELRKKEAKKAEAERFKKKYEK